MSHSCSQISGSNVQNSGGVQNSAQIPDIQITGCNSVAPVDSEMANVDDPLLETSEVSPGEFKTLRKLLSPANVKRIGLGRLPGDQGLKPKNKKHK